MNAELAEKLVLLRDRGVELTSARWVWVTPTAVDETLAAAFVHFQRAGISWATADMEDTALLLSGQPEPTIDALSVTMPRRDTALHLDDGVHLTLDGQRAVAAAVVATLAQ